ncbi:unnamed protein product [Ectocarpus sp. 13 AM-2016]
MLSRARNRIVLVSATAYPRTPRLPSTWTGPYGPYGLIRPIWTILPASLASQRTLDAPNETMRAAVDLGVLYVVLRLCPYSLVPAAIICRIEKLFR